MKTVCMALLLLLGLSAYGQHEHRGPRHEKEVQFTPEQRAEIHTKKLTLALDLNTSQQKKIQEVLLTQETDRAARKEARAKSDSLRRDPQLRYERMNQRLDAMIAHKKEMKEILTEEQYAKWEKMALKKEHRSRHHQGKKGHRHDRRG